MFTKSDVVSGDRLETIIGKDTTFEGTITAKGSLRIDGEVDGEIFSEGDVNVSESAKLNAQLSARNVIISGIVKGNVTASDRVELSGTSRISGDIQAAKLIVDEGAVFDGKCSMTASAGGIQSPGSAPKEEDESEVVESLHTAGDDFK